MTSIHSPLVPQLDFPTEEVCHSFHLQEWQVAAEQLYEPFSDEVKEILNATGQVLSHDWLYSGFLFLPSLLT